MWTHSEHPSRRLPHLDLLDLREKPILPVVGTKRCSHSNCLLANPLTKKSNARDIIAWPIEACDDAEFDRVATHCENYWDRRRFDWLGFDYRDGATRCNQHAHFLGD